MRPTTHKVLQTERMVLRRMEMADVDDLMDIFSDPVAMRYYPGTKSRQEAEEWVLRVLRSYREHGFGLWVAVLEGSGEVSHSRNSLHSRHRSSRALISASAPLSFGW